MTLIKEYLECVREDVIDTPGTDVWLAVNDTLWNSVWHIYDGGSLSCAQVWYRTNSIYDLISLQPDRHDID
jgi:hypothetical protein